MFWRHSGTTNGSLSTKEQIQASRYHSMTLARACACACAQDRVLHDLRSLASSASKSARQGDFDSASDSLDDLEGAADAYSVDLGDLSERIDALVDGVAVELDFHKICFEARELAEAAETMEQLAAVVAMRNRLEDPKYSQCRVPETLSAIDSLLTAKKQKILTEEIHALEARLRAEIQAAAELEDLGSEVEESLIRQFDSFASLDASTDFEIRSIARAKQKAVVEFIHERKTQLALDAVSLCFETFTTTLSTVDTLEGLGVENEDGETIAKIEESVKAVARTY